MTTPQGDPFTDAAGEAVQTVVASVRLVLAIADAVRRHRERQQRGVEKELPPAEEAVEGAKTALQEGHLPVDVSAALLTGADWPLMAQQLMGLKNAGVSLDEFLPKLGEVAVMVHEAVAPTPPAAEAGPDWVGVVRRSLPAGPAREAILSSPSWADMTASMARLEARGVDVGKVLAQAHDMAIVATWGIVAPAGEAVASRDALLSYGPMTDGLDLPTDLALENRERALVQLAISPHDNARFARMLRDALPGHGREVDLALTSKQWPLVAARMAKMEDAGKPIAEHLAGLTKDLSWETGAPAQIGSRLVQAANHVLRHAPGAAPPVARPKVSTTAAKAQSTTVGPTKKQAAVPSAEPGVAVHRQAGPAVGQGRTR
ncbi:hypothetical protein [Streptomyces hydrogenans]|uniref:hypothetical protein n=1 Tax=Streptomyces hydrogenans TaxID=1873719 RepID=UPI003414E722